MALRIHVNNFETTLNGAILNTDLTAVLSSSTGLPVLSGGDYYYLTFVSGATVEIVKVTARTSNTITIVRAQEGTSAAGWASGTIVSLRATADSLDRKADLNSPILITPALGTPSSGVLSSCSGYAQSALTGLGSGVSTFLGTPSSANLITAVTDETGSGALVFANTPTLVTPILGTPNSGTLSSCTGYAQSALTGLGTGVSTFLGTPSSANLAAAITDETGSGALVFATSPTFVTPILGTPQSGTLSSCSGYAQSALTGLGSGVSTFLATPTSANFTSAVGTLAIASGGTAVTSVTVAPTATSFAGWDANKNFSANSVIPGYRTTATAGATTTLTIADTEYQYFTGSTTQTVVLPVTSTLVLGQAYTIVNNSSGSVTVQSSGTNTIATLTATTSSRFVVVSTSLTTAAAWNVMPANIAGVASVAGTANQIAASAATGAVTLSLVSNPTIPGTQGVILPQGSTGSRPGAGSFGRVRANTSTGFYEFDNGASWQLLPGAPETVTANAIPKFTSTNNPSLSVSGITIDSSNNLIGVNNNVDGYTTFATNATTTTLTVASTRQQFFTGSTTQTVKLPVTSTLTTGHSYRIVNDSSGVVTVQSSGSNTIQAMAANTVAIYTCISTSGTGISSWDYCYTSNASDITGSGSLVRATSPALVTPTLGVASATSINFGEETLSHYDEGTWTPTIEFFTLGDLSVAYTAQTGKYIRIGNQVTVEVYVNFTPTYTTAASYLIIKNLPFAPNTTIGGSGSLSDKSAFAFPVGYTQISLNAALGGIIIIGDATGTVGSILTTTQFPTATAAYVVFSLTYSMV